MRHDIDYALSTLQPDEKGRVKAVREADNRMISSLNRIKKEKGDRNVNIALGKRIIQAKKKGEDFGLIRKGAFGSALGSEKEQDINILKRQKEILQQQGYGSAHTLLKKATKGGAKYSSTQYTVKPTFHKGHGTNPAGHTGSGFFDGSIATISRGKGKRLSGRGFNFKKLAGSIFNRAVNKGKDLLKEKIADGTVSNLLTNAGKKAGTTLGSKIGQKIKEKTGMEYTEQIQSGIDKGVSAGTTALDSKIKGLAGSGIKKHLWNAVNNIKPETVERYADAIVKKSGNNIKKIVDVATRLGAKYVDAKLAKVLKISSGSGLNLAGKPRSRSHSGCGIVVKTDMLEKEMKGGFIFAGLFAFFAWLGSALAGVATSVVATAGTIASIEIAGTTIGTIASTVGTAVAEATVGAVVNEVMSGEGGKTTTPHAEVKKIINTIPKIKLKPSDFPSHIVDMVKKVVDKGEKPTKQQVLKLADKVLPHAKLVFTKKLQSKTGQSGSGVNLSGIKGAGFDKKVMMALKSSI